MTEAEWFVCNDPKPMLRFLRGKASERKMRFVACGRCRVMWAEMVDDRSKHAVEVAEACADGRVSKKYRRMLRELRNETERLAIEAHDVAVERVGQKHPHAVASLSAVFAVGPYCISVEPYLDPGFTQIDLTIEVRILRELFGNPFRPVSLDPVWLSWNDGTVIKLAQAIYADRAFDRLPILADALEEAGCSDQGIIGHCRPGGEHVRGCWLVDLLSGKE